MRKVLALKNMPFAKKGQSFRRRTDGMFLINRWAISLYDMEKMVKEKWFKMLEV